MSVTSTNTTNATMGYLCLKALLCATVDLMSLCACSCSQTLVLTMDCRLAQRLVAEATL